MKEQDVVNYIELLLKKNGRYFVNVHGSSFGKNGTPDFITHDKNGIFVGLEAKAPKKKPYTNQWARGIEILKSGGRFIIAQDDFDLEAMDDQKIKSLHISGIKGESEFEAAKLPIVGTTEIFLKN